MTYSTEVFRKYFDQLKNMAKQALADKHWDEFRDALYEYMTET